MGPAVIEPIVQKDGADCVIASVAMISERPYKEISSAALELWPQPHKTGLSVKDTQRLLKKVLGRTWESLLPKSIQLEEETGVLFVRLSEGYHAVALFEGVIVNPADGLIWSLHAYLATKKAHPVRFLRP